MHEFELITHYFSDKTLNRSDVILGIGDDCALLRVPSGYDLAVSMDTLVAGIHFPIETAPDDIAYKAVAVNLSDLAAMGAEPTWLTGALTLPTVDEGWLEKFSEGFFELLNRFQVQLVGGDLTKGPLSITLQAHGIVPTGAALCRHGAKPGDFIYVTGALGDAALALQWLKQHQVPNAQLLNRLNRPEPRLVIGQALRGIATSAIDISDGLVADLGHILTKSGVGASIQTEYLPLSEAMRNTVSIEQAYQLALTGGDDYELCFTAPPEQKIPNDLGVMIGQVESELGLRVYCGGKIYSSEDMALSGYQHF